MMRDPQLGKRFQNKHTSSLHTLTWAASVAFYFVTVNAFLVTWNQEFCFSGVAAITVFLAPHTTLTVRLQNKNISHYFGVRRNTRN